MKFINVLLIGFLIVGCSYEADDGLPPGKRAGGFSYSDQNKQALVLKMMSEKEIKYTIGSHNEVIYLLKNQAEVLGIQREVEYGKNLKENIWEGTVLINDIERQKYEAAFALHKIPYKVSEYEGTTQINWSQIYGPRVDTIRQQIDLEVMDIYLENNHN